MSMSTPNSANRIDGKLKVTGGVRYSAEITLPDLVYAVLVDSSAACGHIRQIDTHAAEQAPGVLAVITHLNAPPLHYPANAPQGGTATLRRVALRAFEGAQIYFAGQHVAMVVAQTLEQATYAASLVKVTYDVEPPMTDLMEHLHRAYRPQKINGNREPDSDSGDVERALSEADVVLDATYTTPIEHHHPLELSSCTAIWTGEGDARTLTVYDTTQAVYPLRTTLAGTFGLPEERVRVICEFLGGGFGCKLPGRPHSALAAIAAERTARPVKLVLTRKQMFTSVGHRPASMQRMRLGAMRNGQLTAIVHDAILSTATHEEWVEHSAAMSRMLYACENRRTTHRAVKLNIDTPTIMRAPGEAPGSFATESAMDELAQRLGIDPIELRLRNYAHTDPENGKAWSSNSLRECLQQGAERFGWSERDAKTGMRRIGHELVGFGVAAAVRTVILSLSTVRVRLFGDGTAEVATAAHDIGTGTYTFAAQIAAQILGMPLDAIRVKLGDSSLPTSPPAGGSTTAPSVGSAVHIAATNTKNRLIELAVADRGSVLFGAQPGAIDLVGGKLAGAVSQQAESIDDLLRRNGYGPGRPLEVEGKYTPPAASANAFSLYGFGAQFCEVRVDADLGLVRIERMLGVFSGGRVLNRKTAHSQLIGGMIGGIGAALLEETRIDPRMGRIVNSNIADYLMPVNADIRNIDAIVLDEVDLHVNPIGVKGLGEVPIIGVAAAIANAVYNATGVRVRELPINAEKLVEALKR